MEPHKFILILFAFAIVAADILIRLRLTSARRERYMKNLLGMLAPADEISHRREDPELPRPEVSLGTDVTNSLLKCFERSFASRQIVGVLAEAPRGITAKELEERFAELAGRAGKNAVPARAIRKVVMNLMSAELVRLRGGRLRTTELGRALHALLNSREEA